MNGMRDEVRACSTVTSSIRLAHETSRSESFSIDLSLPSSGRKPEGPVARRQEFTRASRARG